jgi:hypothetical protein
MHEQRKHKLQLCKEPLPICIPDMQLHAENLFQNEIITRTFSFHPVGQNIRITATPTQLPHFE